MEYSSLKQIINRKSHSSFPFFFDWFPLRVKLINGLSFDGCLCFYLPISHHLLFYYFFTCHHTPPSNPTSQLISSLMVFALFARLTRAQNGYNFDFRLSYKVLQRENAVVRFGGGIDPVSNLFSNRYNKGLPSFCFSLNFH